MDYILDGIFSSWLLALIPIVLFFALIIILLFNVSFKSEKLNSFCRLTLILLFPITLTTFYTLSESWGYGYADEFEDCAANKNWICLVTEGTFKMHQRRSSTQLDQRLNVLDIKTGKRIHRDVIGYFNKIIKLSGDTLFYESSSNGYKLYNVSEGKRIVSITPETLTNMFKELSAGVDDCKYDETTEWIKIITKTGLTYYLDPFSMKLQTEEPAGGKNNEDNTVYRFISDYLEIDKEHLFRLNSKKDGPLYQLVDKKENVVADNLLDADLVGNSSRLHLFLVRSYETTDKANFLITCFSYDGKLIWQVKQSSFNADDYFTRSNRTGRHAYTSTMDKHKMTSDSFIFTIQGFVFSVDLNSGKTNWSARL